MLAEAYSVFLQYLQVVLAFCGFVLVVAIALFVLRLPSLYLSFRASNWLMTQGRIETAHVIGFARQYLVQLGYSYSVEGVIFSGFVTQQFADEQDAWEYVDQVKGQAIFVRYHPVNPAISAVRSADQTALAISSRRNLVAQLLGSDLIELFTHVDRDTFKSSRDWPTVRGRVESGKVTQKREAGLWYLISSYTGEVGYSYSVEGHYYAGSLSKTFFREDSARRFVEKLKDREVFVSYSPEQPRISRLRREDQAGALLA
jgi:Protein of unknown function (DUF3592)